MMTTEDALKTLLESSDLIIVGGETYLLAPVAPEQIDALSAYNAGAADREPDDDEPDDSAQIENLDRLTAATRERRAHRYGAAA